MATLKSERLTLTFPENGHRRDIWPRDFGINELDSSGKSGPLFTLVTTTAGLPALVPYAVPISVNGDLRPLFAVLQHRDIVRIGEYEYTLDALADGSDRPCTVCNGTPQGASHRTCPLCGAAYCSACETRAAGRRCVGQMCRFRFPQPAARANA